MLWDLHNHCTSHNSAILWPIGTLLLQGQKAGHFPKRESQRTAWRSLFDYGRDFVAVGLILLSALFLLPFNLYTLQAKGWRSPLIICLLVFGTVLMILFDVW